jgi:uncharacterized protein YoxC
MLATGEATTVVAMPGAGLVRRGAVVTAVVAAAALATSCGGSKSTSTADWANNLCSALVTWSTSVRSATDSLKGNVTESSLKSASDDITKATDELESDLKGLGKPDTEAGEKAKETVDDLSGQLKSDVDAIDEAVKGASGTSGVLEAVSTVSSTLATVGNQVRAAFTDLQQLDAKGELEKAFRNAESCKTLSNQQS